MAVLLGFALLAGGCAPKAPELPEMPDVPEVSDVPEVPDVPETPVIPEVPEAPEEPEEPEAPGEPELPEVPVEPPEKEDFVRVVDYIPGIFVDLKYAGEDNFTGTVVYDFTDAYLRYGTVEKLKTVQEAVAAEGYALKIWDAFRPAAAQFALWEICPDPVYVANPNRGFSSHTRGNTVDVTLVYADGTELEMPTGFDDFSPLADRDYSDCTETAGANAQYLEDRMTEAGFKPYAGEWWHFSDTDRYEAEESFQPGGGGIDFREDEK